MSLLLREIFCKAATDGDLRRHIANGTFDLHETVGNCNTRTPVYIDDENMKLVDAERLFHSGKRPVSCLPVIRIQEEGKEVLGMLVLSDTIKSLA